MSWEHVSHVGEVVIIGGYRFKVTKAVARKVQMLLVERLRGRSLRRFLKLQPNKMTRKINFLEICGFALVLGAAQGFSIAPHWALIQLLSLAGICFLFVFLLSCSEHLSWFCLDWVGLAPPFAGFIFSIHDYGYQPAWVAVIAVVAFASLLAIFPAAAGLLSGLGLRDRSRKIGFSSC